jgi:O-methyltransferase
VADLTIQNTNPALLIGFGDAALKLGRFDTALGLYRAAMRQTKAPSLALLSRIGLAASPSSRSPAMLQALSALEGIDAGTAFVGEGLATWLKHPPFVFDPRFLDLASRHAGLLPAANWHWNLSTALWAAKRARTVEGDFVELGVFKGHTTRFLADYLGFQDWPKTWFLYDTFEGIPQDQLDAGWEDANARAYDGAYSLEEVLGRFADIPNIRVVPGRVPEVLAETCPDVIAFLHVDLNNATAEIQALEALWERISPGGVILFDDFCWSASLRQQRAETAWFEASGEQILALPTGQGLFVKR